MSKIGVLFPKPDAYHEADLTNHEGFKAFSRPAEEKCLRLLLTGCFEPTFYTSAATQVKDAIEVFEQMAQADPELFGKMIIYARNTGLLRLVPTTALVVLSKHSPLVFRRVFDRVIGTPGDLQDFVELVKQGAIRTGFGRSVKAAINGWLNNITEYHAIKYGSKGAKFSLRDIMRITHPNPTGEKQTALFSYLVNGRPDKWTKDYLSKSMEWGNFHSFLPQVATFEDMKRSNTPIRQRELVMSGRLPHEVVTGALKPDIEMWEVLMTQMPYKALLMNLNTLASHGVFNNPSNVEYVYKFLTDPNRVKYCKVLPFRFYTAYKNLTSSVPRRIHEAVEIGLELSFDIMEELPGTICIGSDVSGSMDRVISAKGTTRYIDICGIFTAAILKKSNNAIVLPFEFTVKDNVKMSSRDTLMTTTNTLASIRGGGTAVSAPIQWLIDRRVQVDTFIGITDGEDWVGKGFANVWREYRKLYPKSEAYLLTISPYNDWMTKSDEPGINWIYGWSSTTPEYIMSSISGKFTQWDKIRAINLYGNTPVELVEED